MRIRKIYENVMSEEWRIGKNIESICFRWKEKLNLQEFYISENKKSLTMKYYNELNDFTYSDFNEFVQTLMELKLEWKYTDGRNFVIYYNHADPDEIETYLDANKYNL